MRDLNLTFRPDLQGLRAIAILLVVMAHAGLTHFSGGFIGVDVFFVLSGYLITGLLLRELEQNGRIDFMRFYARRLKRLLPALVVMLITTSGTALLLLSYTEAAAQLASAPFAVTWTSNFFFTFTALDYFDELASRDLFLHTWSLGVEEQFYLIWPVMLLILFRFVRMRRIVASYASELLLPAYGLIFLISLALSLYWTVNAPQWAFYLMPSRIWQFALGAIIYLVYQGKLSPKTSLALSLGKVSAWISLGAGLIMIFASAIIIHPDMPYPGGWALAPSFGAGLLILAGNRLSDGHGGPLAHPILVWLGDRSYSLYLWHWPVFGLGISLGFQDQFLPTLSLILISLLAATLSYWLIERPFWKGCLSHASSSHILVTSLLLMFAVAFALFSGLRSTRQIGAATDIGNQWRNDFPGIYHMPCDAWYSHARVEPCVFGKQSARRTVVFLGDSIGMQWFSMIPAIFPEPDWRTVVLTKSSCAMVDEDYFYQRIGKIYQVCTDWRNAVLDEINKLNPEVLIIGSAATYGFSETQWVEGTTRVLDRLKNAAETIFVIPGTPSLGFDGPGCISRNTSPEGHINRSACEAEDRLQYIDSVTYFLEQAADRFPNVHVLDLNDLVCPGASCNAVSESGMVVFRDSQHLTDSFVRSRIPYIRDRLNRY